MRAKARFVLLLIASTCFCFHPNMAQTPPPQPSGSIHGRVTDPSGAIVRDAAVLIMEPDTQRNIPATTNIMGTFQVNGLTAGIYDVTVDVTGFRFFTAFAVHVLPSQSTQVDAHLVIDTEEDEVQVNAQSNPIDTAPDSNANAG